MKHHADYEDHEDGITPLNDEDTLQCEQCRMKEERHKMVRHEVSGNVICKTCVGDYIKQLCDGDELNPQFIEL